MNEFAMIKDLNLEKKDKELFYTVAAGGENVFPKWLNKFAGKVFPFNKFTVLWILFLTVIVIIAVSFLLLLPIGLSFLFEGTIFSFSDDFLPMIFIVFLLSYLFQQIGQRNKLIRILYNHIHEKEFIEEELRQKNEADH